MTLISVCGSFAHPDLTPAAGYVMFTPRVTHITVSGGPIELGTVEAILDDTGNFTIDLQATDDPACNPTGWTYEVREEVGGGVHRTYDMEIPIATVGCLDFNAAAPVEGAAGSVQLTPGPPGPPGSAVGTYSVGTKPTTIYGQPPLVVGAWTELWPDNDNRTFASVLGGTGVPGEIIYITANPLAAVTDPDVAQIHGDAGALYFETRGVNALYAQLDSGGPLVVRTSQSTSVARSPLPSGVIGVPDYRVLTDCGGGPVTYVHFTGVPNTNYAPVLADDEMRLRLTLFADTADPLVVQSPVIPFDFIAAAQVPPTASTGSFFPGSVAVEGTNSVRAVTYGAGVLPGNVFWVRDLMEVLP